MFPHFAAFAVVTILVFGLLRRRLFTPHERARRKLKNLPLRTGGPAGEQRRAARCGKNSVRILVRKGEEEKLGNGWITNRSDRGLGLLLVDAATVWSTGPAAPDDVLEIKPVDVPGGCPWVPVQIRHIVQQADYWVAGGRLLAALPASLLPVFGFVSPQTGAGRVDVLTRRN
jgi:hypothetical protein